MSGESTLAEKLGPPLRRRQSFLRIGLSRRRRLKNHLMLGLICLAALVAMVPLFAVFFHVLKMGAPALSWTFLTSLPTPVGQTGGGMGNAVLGSAILVGMGTLLGVPLGVLGGVFLAEYGQGKLATSLRFCVDLLTSIPSIIIGLYIYALVVEPMHGFSAWAGGLALAMLMFPFVVKTTEEVLSLIPDHIREAGLALGIPRWRVILSIVLKGAIPSVATGVILGVARIAGETAPLLFTAFGNRNWPESLNQPAPSLPVQIYSYAISPFAEWHQQAWAGAFLLLLLVLLFNLVARFLIFREKAGHSS
jgi:phosphate transport system permease protein